MIIIWHIDAVITAIFMGKDINVTQFNPTPFYTFCGSYHQERVAADNAVIQRSRGVHIQEEC
jgi:hypothetical protein